MARPLRIVYPGALYHITARGNEKRKIFVDDWDRAAMLEKLAASLSRYQVRLYAYVLMSNHYHLIASTPRGNLSRFMQHLNGSYTGWFNRRHGRQGHLFEGRFKGRLVEEDYYLLNLTRYVHLNPVKVKKLAAWTLKRKIEYLRQYRWSSYRGYAGLEGRKRLVDYEPLDAMIGGRRRKKEEAYREMVESGAAKTDEEMKEALEISSKAIGGKEFCRQIEQLHQGQVEKVGNPVEISRRRVEAGWDPERLMAKVAGFFHLEASELRLLRGKARARLAAMKSLHEQAGLSQQQVALWLGLKSGSRVSHYLKELKDELKQDRQLQRQMINLNEVLARKC